VFIDFEDVSMTFEEYYMLQENKMISKSLFLLNEQNQKNCTFEL
jgi:hypothetical protein